MDKFLEELGKEIVKAIKADSDDDFILGLAEARALYLRSSSMFIFAIDSTLEYIEQAGGSQEYIDGFNKAHATYKDNMGH